ncbi:MAG TPA: hypothetical protein VIW47_11595 [Nitrospiraceae bacterium]|jgi:ElaB/YqjD/DUF883 family membrane-anchored ribosome-binding protein
MSPKDVSRMEATGESRGQARVRVAERAEELAGSIDQTLDSAEQAIQQTLQRTKISTRAAIGTVAEGIDTTTAYLSDRGMTGVVEDMEALIRRYPLQAFLIGSSVGFLLSRSWNR